MIRFTFFGIPVEIQPWFWVIMALLGSGFGKVGSTANEALNIALFVIAGFISIFIHELGHALTGKFYKARPFIVLHSFGGIAAFPGSQFTRSRDEDMDEFVRRLDARGISTTIRDTRGDEIDAACGQLAASDG